VANLKPEPKPEYLFIPRYGTDGKMRAVYVLHTYLGFSDETPDAKVLA
jgi:hypothetical protein